MRLNTLESYRQLTLYGTVILVVICLFPWLYQLMGGSFGVNFDVEFYQDQYIHIQDLHHAAQGSYIHTILEWSSVSLAVCTFLFGLGYFSSKQDAVIFLISLTLLCAGMTDAFHTFAADRLIDARAPNQDLIPFSWAASRLFCSLILVIGTVFVLRGGRRVAYLSVGKLMSLAIGFSLITYVLIQYLSNSAALPKTQFPDSLITRPYDLYPLIFFCFFLVYQIPRLYRSHPGYFVISLGLSMIPHIATQLYMAFDSSHLFDHGFNVGHSLKILAYGVPLIGIIFEMSHNIALEQQARLETEKAQREALALAEAKSNFLSNMSHEIRTPMNGIIASSMLLKDTQLDQDQQDLNQMISDSSKGLLTVVNDILDFTKIESGKMELDPHPTDLRQEVKIIQEIFRHQIQEKGIDFDVELESNILFIEVDAMRLRQILVNIVGNAIKFTQEGFVKLKIYSTSHSDQVDLYYFEVQDSGIGMSAEHLEHVFDRFTQADAGVARKFGGSGLGTTISKQLVKLMGGEIDVRSQVGQGTEFQIRIPLTTIESYCEFKPGVQKGQYDLKVAVVEDNKINQKVVQKTLEKLGCQVQVFPLGEACLAGYQEFNPDLILMDINMPGLDGYQTTEKLLELGYTGPIVAMTAAVLEEERQKIEDSGMDGFIPKPFNFEILQATLNRVTIDK